MAFGNLQQRKVFIWIAIGHCFEIVRFVFDRTVVTFLVRVWWLWNSYGASGCTCTLHVFQSFQTGKSSSNSKPRTCASSALLPVQWLFGSLQNAQLSSKSAFRVLGLSSSNSANVHKLGILSDFLKAFKTRFCTGDNGFIGGGNRVPLVWGVETAKFVLEPDLFKAWHWHLLAH